MSLPSTPFNLLLFSKHFSGTWLTEVSSQSYLHLPPSHSPFVWYIYSQQQLISQLSYLILGEKKDISSKSDDKNELGKLH